MDKARALIGNRLLSFLEKPSTDPSKKKPPKYVLVLVWIAFNFLLFQIDLMSAVSVGVLNYAIHKILFVALGAALLTLSAGFGPTLLAEAMYTNPYASKYQKIVAIVVAIVGLLSTFAFGATSAIMNVVLYSSTAKLGDWVVWVEVFIGILLVVAGITHVILLGVYFFIDGGILSSQKRQENLAYYATQMQEMSDAGQLVSAAKGLEALIDGKSEEEAAALVVAYSQLSGKVVDITKNSNPSS